MRRTRSYLRALIDIRFYSTLLMHVRATFGRLLADYQTNLEAGKERSPAKARLRLRKDIFVSDYRNLVVGEAAEIDRDVRIVFPSGDDNDDRTNITLGNHIFLGRGVSLGVLRGNRISIGDYTTINDNCVILGDVSLEKYCTLSLNIFISSGNHYATLFPHWLIKDQDAFVHNSAEHLDRHSSPVHIEEDCWLGWGVFVKRGVYIGRGAVIGAYSVVTRDVSPYSVQVGAPNREIARRFDFRPPRELHATCENDWPYFYAGFSMRQNDIAVSRKKNLLLAGARVRCMLEGGPFDTLFISGELNDEIEQLRLAVACNGVPLGEIVLKERKFREELEVKTQAWENPITGIPSVLCNYNEIELRVVPLEDHEPVAGDSHYGITSISIRPKMAPVTG